MRGTAGGLGGFYSGYIGRTHFVGRDLSRQGDRDVQRKSVGINPDLRTLFLSCCSVLTETVLLKRKIELDHQLGTVAQKLHRTAHVVQKRNAAPVTLRIGGDFSSHLMVVETVPAIAHPDAQ